MDVSNRASHSVDRRPQLRVVPGGASCADRGLLSDDELIEAVRRGDHKVAGGLYDRLCGVVDGTIYRLLGRREADHDDLVQSAFEQIVLSITRRTFARECSLTTWAATVAAHVGLNALRARTRERRVLDRSAAPDLDSVHSKSHSDVEREVLARRELERIRSHLAAMSHERAEALVLHDVLGHELNDIAAMTGVSVAAAQSRLVRGRRELAARMADGGPHDDEREEA